MLSRTKAGAILAIIAAIALAPSQAPARNAMLIDQTGRAFSFASLRGEPLAVTFVAAHCTDACPLINAEFAQAAQTFKSRGIHARLLTITLDPEHDPPKVMRDLARRFGADPHTWLVASGNIEDVRAIMWAFGVVAQRGRSGYADVHTTFVYIFDKNGKLRKRILGSTALGAELASEVRS